LHDTMPPGRYIEPNTQGFVTNPFLLTDIENVHDQQQANMQRLT
jgi:hypothetical protein